MTNTVTLVTAFFDIGREKNGDGRSIDDYKKWIKTTLQLNCNMYIVTEEKFRDFFVQNRPSHLPTKIHIMPFVDSHYYRYYDQMTRIIQSDDYRSKIAHPRRVECVLPEYNVIQYSKFHYLEMAISDNPFHSTHFFWLDAGVSRFFMDVDITRPYPSPHTVQQLEYESRFIIQRRHDLDTYPLDDDFVWKSDNLLSGGMFGGPAEVVLKVARLLEQIFQEKMLDRQNVNNEQLGLALVWKYNPELFHLVNNIYGEHLSLFKLLAL